MRYIIPIVASFSGGALVGGAIAAFITLLKIIPRLIQVTETDGFLKMYEDIFITSAFIFSVLYFTEYSINLGTLVAIIIGLTLGTFVGLLTSALAETLNVMPIISKKFKFKDYKIVIVISLLLGKVAGSLYYFLIHVGG